MSPNLIAIAEESYRLGDYLAAAKMLEPAAAEAAPLPDVLRLLGLCRLRMGALACARKPKRLGPDTAARRSWARSRREQVHVRIGSQAEELL